MKFLLSMTRRGFIKLLFGAAVAPTALARAAAAPRFSVIPTTSGRWSSTTPNYPNWVVGFKGDSHMEPAIIRAPYRVTYGALPLDLGPLRGKSLLVGMLDESHYRRFTL